MHNRDYAVWLGPKARRTLEPSSRANHLARFIAQQNSPISNKFDIVLTASRGNTPVKSSAHERNSPSKLPPRI